MSATSHLFSLDTPTGVRLEGERAGSGVPVILLHGLTATRRYVVTGSRYLARAGAELIAFDARGHGESGPAPDPAAYKYADMVGDRIARQGASALDNARLNELLEHIRAA